MSSSLKTLFVFVLSAIALIGRCQQKSDFSLSPKVGTQISIPAFPGPFGMDKKPYSSLMLGLSMNIPNIPISLSVENAWAVQVQSGNANPLTPDIDQTWNEFSGHARYALSWGSVGVGYYRMRFQQENWRSSIYQGAYLSASKQLGWLSVEFRTRLNFSPSFSALLGFEHHSLTFAYELNPTPKKTETKFNKAFDLSLNLGMRGFPIQGLQNPGTEDFPAVGIAPTFGLELLHEKSNISALVMRDIWVSLNPGSTDRGIKGHISSIFMGIRYHKTLRNGRDFRYGIGYSLIRDLDLENANIYNLRFKNYQVKGVGIVVGYEVIPELDVEFKHTLSTASISNESLFRPIRMSLGLIYRLRPGKDSEKQNSYF